MHYNIEMQEVNSKTRLADGKLLEMFFQQSDQSALAEIVDRHKELVWTVCARNLSNQADIEDAFQATFLLLARKASSIRKADSLASWLHGVSHRLALRAKALLGARTGMTADVLDVLLREDLESPERACRELGIELRPLDDTIAHTLEIG